MNVHVIILVVVAIATLAGLIYFGFKSAELVDDDNIPVPKFQPRQVTDLSKPELPKKKYYKRKNKKKPTVAENTTVVEKKPVGRPKLSK
jgi:hypothetical protein